LSSFYDPLRKLKNITQDAKKATSKRSLVNEKIENPLVIVLSNAIDECKENLKLNNAEYLDWHTQSNSFKDMQLMSLCHHNIIANSSFSWRWLNANPNKIVISPKKWIKDLECLNDLIPSDWFKI